jgi:hypothetical protein
VLHGEFTYNGVGSVRLQQERVRHGDFTSYRVGPVRLRQQRVRRGEFTSYRVGPVRLCSSDVKHTSLVIVPSLSISKYHLFYESENVGFSFKRQNIS